MKYPKLSTFLLAVAALLALSGYNCNDILEDPGFDLWCEDTLCAWTLESGQIQRVDTWHASDYGVELVGNDVAISQFADRAAIECVRFELIADVEDTADVVLEVDLSNDGTIEHEQRIPSSDWQQLSYLIPLELGYDGILFRIRKRGYGHAVLAEIAALSESSSECHGLPPSSIPWAEDWAEVSTEASPASQDCVNVGLAHGACQ